MLLCLWLLPQASCGPDLMVSPESSTTSTTASTGAGGGGGAGGGSPCSDPSVDCPPPSSPCVSASCRSGGCAEEPLPEHTVTGDQTPGDCQVVQCDGAGATTEVEDDSDLPDDGNDCTLDICNARVPGNPAAALGTACAQDGGFVCDDSGHCVECNDGGDCQSGVCQADQCQAPTCADDVRNGEETDVDCGGLGSGCPACLDGQACTMATDCQGGVCDLGLMCCTPVPVASLCASTCGVVTDNCGTPIDCGGCGGAQTCGGGGVQNACGCASPPCPVWVHGYGSASTVLFADATADSLGNVLVAGYFAGTLDLGGAPLVALGGSDTFLAKLGPSGNHTWSKSIGLAGAFAYTFALAADGVGAAVIAVASGPGIDFGGGPLNNGEICTAKYDANGVHVWSKCFGGAGAPSQVAVDGSGDIVLAGRYSGTVDFGGGPIVASGNDMFLAKLDAQGNHLWSHHYGNNVTVTGLAVDSQGAPVVTGYFSGSVDFGGGPIATASWEGFVARISPQGTHVWSMGLPANGTGGLNSNSVAVDPLGDALIVGEMSGSMDLGCGVINAPQSDIFVAKLKAAGGCSWSAVYGNPANADYLDIAADSAGNALVSGRFYQGSINFGGSTLQSTGGYDIFVAKLDPSGGHIWSKSIGGGGADYAWAIAADAAGNALLSGTFDPPVNFGMGALFSGDLFVAKFCSGKCTLAPSHVWAFNENNGGTASDTIGGVSGLLQNGPAWQSGKVGSALHFDGVDDRVDLPSPGSLATDLSGASDFTISAWVNLDQVVQHNFILGEVTQGFELYVNSAYGPGPYLYMNGASGCDSTASLSPVSAAVWHHVLTTWDAGAKDAEIWLDGVLQLQSTQCNDFVGPAPLNAPWTIGSYGATMSLHGALDELVVWPRRLPDQEILAEYNAGLGVAH